MKKMNKNLNINFTKWKNIDVGSVFANTKKFNKTLKEKMKFA